MDLWSVCLYKLQRSPTVWCPVWDRKWLRNYRGPLKIEICWGTWLPNCKRGDRWWCRWRSPCKFRLTDVHCLSLDRPLQWRVKLPVRHITLAIWQDLPCLLPGTLSHLIEWINPLSKDTIGLTCDFGAFCASGCRRLAARHESESSSAGHGWHLVGCQGWYCACWHGIVRNPRSLQTCP